MKRIIASALVALTFSAGLATAQEAEEADSIAEELSVVERWQADPTTVFDAAEVDLDDLVYIARPLIVFANTANDPRFDEQMEYLLERIDQLVERDVIIIVDTDPDAETSVRQTLRPRNFSLVLIAKDGRVAFRKPFPWEVREITRSIDKMPIRQQELRDG